MDAIVPNKAATARSNGPYRQEVLSVKHWTEDLFSFTLNRPAGFRFRSGEFVMIGLEVNGKPLLRAYSVASPSWDEELEFFSIKVPNGPLTSRLQQITPGDEVLLSRKPTGTLVLDALLPGKRLFLFSTGTGFAPFASVIRDPETYEKFDQIIVTHTCRTVAELDYSRDMIRTIQEDEILSELTGDKLVYFASTTREEFSNMGRITTLLENGKLFSSLGIADLNPETDRAMICGSTVMISDTKDLLEIAGFTEGANNKPADYVIEKAFVG
ncbi:ferredoxin--NADP reductase [Emcibacter sp.]|uniref:ferredoxin--NADP reductase n=1 Tax=Emcibacter sp. TaxID=1979954 RepID=UPI003A93DC60